MKQRLAEWINVIFGMRKFLLMAALYIMAVVFLCLHYIDGAQFTDLLKSTTLSFMVANGTEHLVTVARSYFDNKPETNQLVPLSDIEPNKKV